MGAIQDSLGNVLAVLAANEWPPADGLPKPGLASQRWGAIALLLASFGVIPATPALSQSTEATSPPPANNERLQPDPSSFDLAAFRASTTAKINPGNCADDTDIITEKMICQLRLTIPSLWWTKTQQPLGNKLLEGWLAYPGNADSSRRVDVVVNPQLWGILDYLNRYEMLNRFGTVTADYGYNLRVFDPQGRALGAYTCDFQAVRSPTPADSAPDATTDASARTCRIKLDFTGKGGLGGRPANRF